MKTKIFNCLLIFTFSTFAHASFVYFSIEKRVNANNLIVIGTLQTLSRTETDEFEINNGTLVIESVVYGNFANSVQRKLQKGDRISIEWRNVKSFGCKFGFADDHTEVWFLTVGKDGRIESLGPNSSSDLAKLNEVNKYVKKGSIDKTSKYILLQNEIEKTTKTGSVGQEESANCAFPAYKPETKEYSFFSALLVILASISLYFIMYRSRFKIR